MGRYYKDDFAETALQIICVIDYDIKILYKRVDLYLQKRMSNLEETIIKEEQR